VSDALQGGDGRLDPLEDVPLVGGFVGGIASFLGGFVMFLSLLVGSGELSFARGVQTALRSVAQVFYNAINVPTYTRQTLRVEQGGQTQEQVIEVWANSVTGFQRVTQQQIVDGDVVNEASRAGTAATLSGLPELVYLAVPIVALVAAGVVIGLRARGADDPNAVTLRSVGGGLAMAAGFLLVTLLGTYVLVEQGRNAVLYPSRAHAVLYGVVYPLVAGTAGIVFGQAIRLGSGETTETAEAAGTASTADTEGHTGGGPADAAGATADDDTNPADADVPTEDPDRT
jgi:hypothetical protein